MEEAYGSELYRPEFIIGYTGDLNNKPTVYFHDPETRRVGRITQFWSHLGMRDVTHEGRGAVLGYTESYTKENSFDEEFEETRFSEYIDGESFHTSRGTFTPVNNDNFSLLSRAISRFPQLKFREMRRSTRAKQQAEAYEDESSIRKSIDKMFFRYEHDKRKAAEQKRKRPKNRMR